VSVIEQLVMLQDHDCRIRDMEKELRDIPTRKQKETERLADLKKALEQADQAVKHHQSNIKSAENDIESEKEKIQKLRQQQNQIRTNQEFKASESEIKTLNDHIAAFEDKQLTLMVELDQVKAEFKARQAELAQAQAIVQKDMEAWDARAKTLKDEIDNLKGLRTAVAKDIAAPDWLARYEHIFQRKSDKALVLVEEGVCGGCHMQLPPFIIHEAKHRSTLVTCNFCGRMLY